MTVEKSANGFIGAARQLLREAGEQYEIDISHVTIHLDIRGHTTAGRAKHSPFSGTSVHFNRQNLLHHWDDMLHDTLPHEIAHTVCQLTGWDNGHGATWKRICIELGGSGSTYIPKNLQYIGIHGAYRYALPDGTYYDVKPKTHQTIQKGFCVTLLGHEVRMTNYAGRVTAAGVFKPVVAASHVVANARTSQTASETVDQATQYIAKRLRASYTTGLDVLFNIETAKNIPKEVGIYNDKIATNMVRKIAREIFPDIS